MLIITDDPHGTRPVIEELERRGRAPACLSLGDLARETLSAAARSSVQGERATLYSSSGGRYEINSDTPVWRWKDRALTAFPDLDHDVVDSMKAQQCQGETVFLEINPAGQYLWIEERTGLPITSAIADFLGGESV